MENAAVETPIDDQDFENAFADDAPTETPGTDEIALNPEADPEEEQPRYAQITEDEYRRLMEAADTVSKLGHLQDKAFGKIGGIERYLQQLQSQTPAGVDISEDDVKDLADEYPELGALQLKVLQKVAGKLKGTGIGGINSEQVDVLIQQRLSDAKENVKAEMRRELAEETLDDLQPDWRAVRDSEAFRAWLSGQPEPYQQKAATSLSPSYAAKVIGEFKAAAQPKAAPKPSPQRSRIEAAVTPKSGGGFTPPASDEDDFVAGFNSA